MKAIVYDTYGPPDVLRLAEIDPPVPRDGEVLVRVRAASVNAADWHLLTATPWIMRLFAGLFRPKRKVLGLDVAGAVESVGAAVTRFKPGDAVFGTTDNAGAFAEFMRVPESHLLARPSGLTEEEAAAVPVAALTALQGLRDKGRIQAGRKVLVNGAAGGVGSFAVQIAKAFDAEVTAVCSTQKVDLVRSLGADRIIDYTREDFTRTEDRYDLFLDIVGNRAVADCTRLLTPPGIYVAAAGPPSRLLWVGLTGGKRSTSYVSEARLEDLRFLAELLADGRVKPVIDRRYRLAEVPDALRYFGEGHAAGKVVITV